MPLHVAMPEDVVSVFKLESQIVRKFLQKDVRIFAFMDEG